ncbi:hypothetical protein LRP49_12385 [Enterovibrio sp. ZSDZ35]|uniref:Chitinase n=1 Tax=Enterovibrio qingdaonensis TaxID=2899818 RepID=A0ABT5QMS2_9GAMM|nr:hypothetical protein [Enterovibrio sp. ZSDZ35]MDD1781968.1 hypothetical protein [Enterovibrio sp. ZSDZ35]
MRKLSSKHTVLAVAISSALTLSACGGGDEGGTPGGGGGVVQQGGVIITAMDGYLKNALLCADDNSNGICEAGEVIKDTDGHALRTDEKGHIDAKISLDDEKRLETSARLIATIQSLDPDSEVITEDMDLPGQAMKAVTLRAPAGSEIASPITDLVVSKMQSTDTTVGLSKEDAEKAVIASLGGLNTDGELTQDVLYSDYIVAKESGDDASKELAAKIHKTAQILTETKANASSDAAFDAQLDQVVEATVEATAEMAPEDLEDETYKPYVPVVEEPTEPPALVTNFAVTFNKANIEALTTELAKHGAFYGDADKWLDQSVQNIDVQSLVNDSDATALGKQNTVIIANTKALAEKNIAVSLIEGVLTVSRVDTSKDVAAGTHNIQLASNDLNSKGDALPSFVASATTVDFVVENFNYAPEFSPSKLSALQTQFDALKLEVGVPVNQSFNIAGLIFDRNGENDIDHLSTAYSVSGLEIVLRNTSELTITGTPAMAQEPSVLTLGVEDLGGLSDTAEIIVPKVTSVTPSEIKDILVGSHKTWYRWNGESKQNEGGNSYYNFANCMAFQFVESSDPNSGTVLFAEGEQCPQESDVTKQDGTWEVNSDGHLIWSLPGEGNLTFTRTLTQHENDARQPRVTAFELEQKTSLTRESNDNVSMKTNTFESGSTLFKGQASANNYWNDAKGSAWVLDQDTAISLTADLHQQDANQYLGVSLNFINVKCTDLGLAQGDNGNYLPTATSRYKGFRVTGDALNGNALFFNTNSQGFEAFQSSDKCSIHLPIYTNATPFAIDFKAGQTLTVHASEAENIGDEEFIINTFIDRDYTIAPAHDLQIDGIGIYFVDGTSVSNIYRTEANGTYTFLERSMSYENGVWGAWQPFGDSQLITQYVASNGNHAYQFFNEGEQYNSDESFTIWANSADVMFGKDVAPGAEIWDQKIFYSLAEAQAAVEAVVSSEISFVGSVWKETFITAGSEKWDYAEFTYQQNGVSIVEYKDNVAGEATLYPYTPENSDLPCRDTAPHTCSFEQLNQSNSFVDDNGQAQAKWEWDPITNPNKMWRHKDYHESEWVRLK